MAVLRIRPGVTIQNPAPAGFRILSALDQLALMRLNDLVITSGDEGGDWRSASDPHQTGEAYDVSVKGWSEDDVIVGYKYLTRLLGARFTVLYEVPPQIVDSLPQALKDIAYVNPKATGIHVHIQRKRGTTYP